MHRFIAATTYFLAMAFITWVSGCTLYQSEGRKCIKEGCTSFVSATSFVVQAKQTCRPIPLAEIQDIEERYFSVVIDEASYLKVYFDLLAQDPKVFVIAGMPNYTVDRVCQFSFNSQWELEEKYMEKVELADKYLSWLDSQT
ncbi:MAG: hypothetical protein KDD61_09005 [Bdellovibrionales bacterium]|nr:hypothetical protein [Bdellovibrionales bacterium]